MSFTINMHTRVWPTKAEVFDSPENDLAWLCVGNGSGTLSIMGSLDRIDAMRRAAAAINEAFGQPQPKPELVDEDEHV